MADIRMLDGFLSSLDVRVSTFTACDLREGWQIAFPPMDTANIHLVLIGEGAIRAANTTLAVAKDTLVVIPAGLAYAFESAPGAPHKYHGNLSPPDGGATLPVIKAGVGRRVMLTACGAVTAQHHGTIDLFRTLPRPIARPLENAHLLTGQLSLLIDELKQIRVGTRPMIDALLKQCVLMLLRDPLLDDALGIPWSKAVAHPPLWRAFVAMTEALDAAHSLNTLATTAGMSRSTFSSHFTQAFGRSPMVLLREMRMHRAAALLADTTLPIDTLARSVGYGSRSQFSNAFRKFHGESPMSFRDR